MLGALFDAMRPHQWVKNLLVLAPLAFAHQYDRPHQVAAAAAAFGVFCLLSSAVYLMNDVFDRHADAAHLTKRHRPIPSGRLPVPVALAASGLLAGIALVGSIRIGPDQLEFPFFAWPVAYLALNLGYTLWLKHVVIVDCLCIALGFQMRVHGGAVAIGVAASSWLLLCTFFFALFLAFCKRREEVERDPTSTGLTRVTTREYDVPFLDQLIAPLAALSILCYALYTVDPRSVTLHGERLKFTVPFVVFGVFRYLFLVHKRGAGADPARWLFRDPQLVLSGGLWVMAVGWVVWTHSSG